MPVNIYFTPNSDKEVNFNVVCTVKRKTLPLTLNVKAEGYSMDCMVLCEDSTGTKIELSADSLNRINFGEVKTSLLNRKTILMYGIANCIRLSLFVGTPSRHDTNVFTYFNTTWTLC